MIGPDKLDQDWTNLVYPLFLSPCTSNITYYVPDPMHLDPGGEHDTVIARNKPTLFE